MREITFEIKLFGEPILRKKTKLVVQVTPQEQDVLSKMAQIMYEKEGIGLAANQIGIDKSMIVVDTGEGLYKLINPKIIKKEGRQILEEGCLSLPGVCIKVKRAAKVRVEAINENGEPFDLESEGLMACCLQHEIDYLKGRLILDYASFFQRLRIRKTLAKIKRSKRDEDLCKPKAEYCKLQL